MAVRTMYDDARAVADEKENENTREIRNSVAAWCREAEANGASRAHRWTQLPEGWRPETTETIMDGVQVVTSNPDALDAREREKLAPLWAPRVTDGDIPTLGLVAALPRPTVREVRAAAKRFRRTTGQGADRLNPRDFADLSDEALEIVIEIMMSCEAIGTLPDSLALVIVVLLEKKGGVDGPSASSLRSIACGLASANHMCGSGSSDGTGGTSRPPAASQPRTWLG